MKETVLVLSVARLLRRVWSLLLSWSTSSSGGKAVSLEGVDASGQDVQVDILDITERNSMWEIEFGECKVNIEGYQHLNREGEGSCITLNRRETRTAY